MNFKLRPQTLKVTFLGAGVLACGLRALLYATAIDGRGLLTANHPLSIVLWALTAAAAAALVLFCHSIKGPERYDDAYPVSFSAFLGCFAAVVGIALSSLRSFGARSTVLDILICVLGFVSVIALASIGICRLTGKKPYTLLHGVVCVWFALRLVSRYRVWSFDPCLQDFFFYLMAHMALMLAFYQHAAFGAAAGSHRAVWAASLAGLYLCCAALYGCEEPLLMAGFALWCFTGLTSLRVRKRRARPALKLDESGESQS